MKTKRFYGSRSQKIVTRVLAGMGLFGACTVVDKGDYTFTDDPAATGGNAGDEGGGGTSGNRGGNSGNAGTSGEGGETAGGTSGTGGTAGSSSGDGGGGSGGDGGDPCDPNPCQNGGDCTASGTTITCDCAPGYEGETCGTNTDDCDPNPCVNNGRCTDLVDDFSCACNPPVTGKTCNLPRFQPLPGPAMTPSMARAVSADGSVVVGRFSGVANGLMLELPVGWSGTVPMPMPMPLLIPPAARNANVYPLAVSGNATRWVGYFLGTNTTDVPQPAGATMMMATTYSLPPNSTAGTIADVNGDGTKAVGSFVDGTGATRAIFWDDNGTPRPLLNPIMSTASYVAGAVSRDGTIVTGVTQDSSGAYFVVSWLDDPSSTVPVRRNPPMQVSHIQVLGVNNDGMAAVGALTNNMGRPLAFVTQNAVLLIIAPPANPGYVTSTAYDVSDDGRAIVGEVAGMGMTGTPLNQAVLWKHDPPGTVSAPRPVYDLLREAQAEPVGWQLLSAYGVSADGRVVVGEANDSNGTRHGYIARLP